jgi:predicted NBD/HSP70 family sugar kinase
MVRHACAEPTTAGLTYISNLATISRYNASHSSTKSGTHNSLTINHIIAPARSGDMKAVAALQATGRYLGLGLGSIIHGLQSGARIYRRAKSRLRGIYLIEPPMRAALVERTLTDEAAATVIQPSKVEHARLNGAAALVATRMFAAPRVA